jgi:hypothetical protein
MTIDALNDVHKTDIHRINSLIKEYKADINDPNTPKQVKKNLQEDLNELQKVLDLYLNDKDEFRRRVNNLIYESISEEDTSKNEKDEKKEDNKNKKDDKKEDEKK